ncbi:MAG: hypothetical protein U0575_03845 [Phycisphaerales bacterium]
MKFSCALQLGRAGVLAGRRACVVVLVPAAARLRRLRLGVGLRAASSSRRFAATILVSRDSRRRGSCGSSSPRKSDRTASSAVLALGLGDDRRDLLPDAACSSSFMQAWLIAFRLLASARIFVPSMASVPSVTESGLGRDADHLRER